MRSPLDRPNTTPRAGFSTTPLMYPLCVRRLRTDLYWGQALQALLSLLSLLSLLDPRSERDELCDHVLFRSLVRSLLAVPRLLDTPKRTA
jgi:hypothetical protein